MRFVKPLDKETLSEIAKNYSYIVTLEDHAILGGAGSAVGEYLNSIQSDAKLLSLGLNDEFPVHGSRNEVLSLNGLDEQNIAQSIQAFINY